MKASSTLVLASLALVASSAVVFAIGAGACSASLAVGVPGSLPVPPGDLPAGVPSACSGYAIYTTADAPGLCGGDSTVWLVCNDGTYSQYVCSEPPVCPGCPERDGSVDVFGAESDDETSSDETSSDEESSSTTTVSESSVATSEASGMSMDAAMDAQFDADMDAGDDDADGF